MKSIMKKILLGLVIILLFSYTPLCTSKKNREQINILFSLSGNYEYRLYYEDLVKRLNTTSVTYEIVPTYVQSDTEAVLKIIYDKSKVQEFDYLLINPKYTELLTRQNLIVPLEEIITKTVGMTILADFTITSLGESLVESEIMSLPFMRETYYFLSESKYGSPITISDIVAMDTGIHMPLKSVLESLLLSNSNLMELHLDENLITALSKLKALIDSGKMINYNTSSYQYDVKNRENQVISSLVLDRVNINENNQNLNIALFIPTLPKVEGTLGSNLFQLKENLTNEANIKLMTDLIGIIFSDDDTYNFPITKKAMNKVDALDRLWIEDDYVLHYKFENIANIDSIVSKLYVDLMKSNYNINEIINNLLELVILKEGSD